MDLSDQHSQWHREWGCFATCDLDCGAGERVAEVFEDDDKVLKILIAAGGSGVKCGACKEHHASAATVKFCHQVKFEDQRARRYRESLVGV